MFFRDKVFHGEVYRDKPGDGDGDEDFSFHAAQDCISMAALGADVPFEANAAMIDVEPSPGIEPVFTQFLCGVPDIIGDVFHDIP